MLAASSLTKMTMLKPRPSRARHAGLDVGQALCQIRLDRAAFGHHDRAAKTVYPTHIAILSAVVDHRSACSGGRMRHSCNISALAVPAGG